MFGLFRKAKESLAVRQFQKSVLGQALQEHIRTYFNSGQALAWMAQESKERFVQDLFARIGTVQASPNPALALREQLVESVLSYASLSVLCLKEDEKADQFYAPNPYISGSLHRHILEAAPHCEETAQKLWRDPDTSAEGMIGYCNTRSTVALFYANAFNMVRMSIGDHDPTRDWYRPFVEAMLVWEEDCFRDKMGMERLTKPILYGLCYSTFMNMVMNGESNPFYTWCQQFPDEYLHGEGPLPKGVVAPA